MPDYLKGRDWYDFLWYTARKTPINYTLLSSALAQVGPWKGVDLSVDYSWCFEALRNKIETTDWQAAAEDVRRLSVFATRNHWISGAVSFSAAT